MLFSQVLYQLGINCHLSQRRWQSGIRQKVGFVFLESRCQRICALVVTEKCKQHVRTDKIDSSSDRNICFPRVWTRLLAHTLACCCLSVFTCYCQVCAIKWAIIFRREGLPQHGHEYIWQQEPPVPISFGRENSHQYSDQGSIVAI